MNQDHYQFFFIRGFMKSGTNWLGRLVGSHPSVRVVGEFHWQRVLKPFNDMIRQKSVFQRLNVDQTARHGMEAMVRQTLIEATGGDHPVIGERTPTTLVPVALRGARHLSIIRDGRDVLVSRAYHLFNNPHVTGMFQRNETMRRDLENFQSDPWYFKKYPERLLAEEEFVRDSVRWWRCHMEQDRHTVQTLPHLQVRFVRYEDLHRDTERHRRELIEFLGLDPAQLPPLNESTRPNDRGERPDAAIRKGAIGDWTNYFTDDVRRWFKEEVRDELKLQGYADDDQW